MAVYVDIRSFTIIVTLNLDDCARCSLKPNEPYTCTYVVQGMKTLIFRLGEFQFYDILLSFVSLFFFIVLSCEEQMDARLIDNHI